MKKQIKITLVVAILLVISVILFQSKLDGLFSDGKGNPSEAIKNTEGQQGSSKLPVDVIQVRSERLENNLNITGNVLPNESVELRPEITGLVESINFEEGQFVKAGTPLVYLNDDELRAQLERLQHTKKLYEGQEKRQKQLLEREAISQEEYDIALNQFNTILADIALIQAQLRKMVIRAPFDGVLGLRQVSVGAVIGTSDKIANIVNIDPIKVEFSIPERYANKVKLGSMISFSNNVTDGEVSGKVYAFEPIVDSQTRTLKLRAISANKKRKFLPGMFVNIQFNLDVEENALMVPSEALVPELNGYKLYLAKEGKVEERKVTIGMRTEKEVQVLNGLQEGDLVLTTGVLQVKEGMPVAINKVN